MQFGLLNKLRASWTISPLVTSLHTTISFDLDLQHAYITGTRFTETYPLRSMTENEITILTFLSRTHLYFTSLHCSIQNDKIFKTAYIVSCLNTYHIVVLLLDTSKHVYITDWEIVDNSSRRCYIVAYSENTPCAIFRITDIRHFILCASYTERAIERICFRDYVSDKRQQHQQQQQ